jgi:hypothetical protein
VLIKHAATQSAARALAHSFRHPDQWRKRVLHEQLRNAWQGRERALQISPVLHLAPQGLVLGAGTVLLAADGPRRLTKLDGQEARVLALLAAAYCRPVAPRVLGNIERAAKAWSEGDDCLAYIHLAHAGLPALQDPHDDARRLFMADGFMKAGTPPRDIIDALGFGADFAATLEKLYNEEEARVPKGSGRPSGEWTDSEEGAGDVAGRAGAAEERAYESPPPTSMPLRAASFLSKLDAAQLVELGLYASRLVIAGGGAAAAFGLLFIPSPNDVRVEGEVPDIPGLRYSWNRDETVLHLTYGRAGGAQRTFALHLDDKVVRDDNGREVGRVIGENQIAIDTLAVLPDLVKQDQPRLCPAPAPDVAGSDQGKEYDENRSRQYEDFLKLLVNPPPMGPTPSGFAYYLPGPRENDKPVSFDDCKWTNGILFEFKGYYGKLLTFPSQAVSDFLSQSLRQIKASGGRPVVWVFAEEEDAKSARRLFDDIDEGRELITIVHVPWTTGRSR